MSTMGKMKRKSPQLQLFGGFLVFVLFWACCCWLGHLWHFTVHLQNPTPLPEWNEVPRAKNLTTLAHLYPPGFLGGYRNQVLRFISLCLYAKLHNITQLFLPSLLWSTQVDGYGTKIEWLPIPMDWVFDIRYWNAQTKSGVLPRLVSRLEHSDCWTQIPFNSTTVQTQLHPLQRAALQQGALYPIRNITEAKISGRLQENVRRMDLLPTVQHCRNPVVYGGGKTSGRLWNDLMSYRKVYSKNTSSRLPFDMDHWVLRALQPAQQWRKLGQQCVQSHVPSGHYVALHARVEIEIFHHACGQEMEWNLTRILQHVEDWFAAATNDHSVSGLFIALSRAGMLEKTSSRDSQLIRDLAVQNLETLNALVGNETHTGRPLTSTKNQERSLAVFECGERLLNKYYQSHPNVPHHGSLLQSVINFDVAVQSDVFVGVRGSSYSNDVLTTRYHLGKGAQNYWYTRKGIEPVEQNGLPEPHFNCGKQKMKTKHSKTIQQ